MDNSKSVLSINDYGKIKICLKELIECKHITRNRLAKLTYTRFEVIDRWYSNNVEKLDLDVLARICYVLECKPQDIIKYDTE